MLIHKREGSQGFTIVELLIVVVVIAILAAITLVAYSGIQQRANNAAITDAASKSLRMIQAYIAANDKYPYTGNGTGVCITLSSGCISQVGTVGTSISTFNNNMATVGSLPQVVPSSGSDRYGVFYVYDQARTLNSQPQPAILLYWLFGTSQQCGLGGVTQEVGGASTLVSSTTGYTVADDSGKTRCRISVPGPSV